MDIKEKDLLHSPHPKVILMYQAVSSMINEGTDINTIKVADITARAGIGKGTAYEYFSTKEEIITKALLYEMMTHMQAMHTLVEERKKFEEKVMGLLDYVAKHFCEGRTLVQILKIVYGAFDISDALKTEFCQRKEENVCGQYELLLDTILKTGRAEGIVKEENVFCQRTVLNSQMAAFSMYLTAQGQREQTNMTLEEAKQFTYNGIVKLLG